MAYRGDDLELRTPQGWAQPGREPASATEAPNWWTRTTVYKGGRADPLWVDDHVMAVCNHAHDLAVAHRAAEVRLEHLLNALTLNEATAQVLESRGVAVAGLRRESGAVIASEPPTAGPNGKSQPRRSDMFEETLRAAADRAYPRRTPITAEDILFVLLDMKREHPGLNLLRRYAPQWQGRNGTGDTRTDYRLEPLPHLARTSAEPPRYASPAAHDYFTPTRQALAPAYREPSTAPVDTVQNTRIESLERAVRDLGQDLVGERKALQSIVEDAVQRSRAEPSQVSPALIDHIMGIERSFDARMSDVGRSWTALGDRLQSLEHAVTQRPGDQGISPAMMQRLDSLSGLDRTIDMRLGELGRSWAGLSDRLQRLEDTLAKRPADTGAGLDRKIDQLEKTFSLILDRLTGMERQLANRTDRPVDLKVVETKLADIERSLSNRTSASGDLGPLTDLLSGIETRIATVERSLDNRAAETGRTVSFVAERLRSFEEKLGAPQSPQQSQQLTERLTQLERSLSAYAERTVETGSSHERDLTELHEALIKLNTNQQMLASSLDQWRTDTMGDLGVINNHLKAIDEVGQQRQPAIDALVKQVTNVHEQVARREVHKSRFRNWLFGTDEWYTASWDTTGWRRRHGLDAPRQGELRPVPTSTQRPTPPAPPASSVRKV